MKDLYDGLKILDKHYTSQCELLEKNCNIKDENWIKAKYQHSIDVFNIAEYLIETDEELQKLTEDQKLYGKLAALLHDIGRAYEVGEMKAKVKPHGYYGADVVLRQLENETNPFILIPVKYHGDLLAEENARKDLNNIENLSNEDKEIIIKLLRLVMDSDKLANLALFKTVDEWHFNFLNLIEEAVISDECFESFCNRELVKIKDRKTLLDKILLIICWAYDLEYQASKALLLKERHLEDYLKMFDKYIEKFKGKTSHADLEKTYKRIEKIKKQLLQDKLINEI